MNATGSSEGVGLLTSKSKRKRNKRPSIAYPKPMPKIEENIEKQQTTTSENSDPEEIKKSFGDVKHKSGQNNPKKHPKFKRVVTDIPVVFKRHNSNTASRINFVTQDSYSQIFTDKAVTRQSVRRAEKSEMGNLMPFKKIGEPKPKVKPIKSKINRPESESKVENKGELKKGNQPKTEWLTVKNNKNRKQPGNKAPVAVPKMNPATVGALNVQNNEKNQYDKTKKAVVGGSIDAIDLDVVVNRKMQLRARTYPKEAPKEENLKSRAKFNKAKSSKKISDNAKKSDNSDEGANGAFDRNKIKNQKIGSPHKVDGSMQPDSVKKVAKEVLKNTKELLETSNEMEKNRRLTCKKKEKRDVKEHKHLSTAKENKVQIIDD